MKKSTIIISSIIVLVVAGLITTGFVYVAKSKTKPVTQPSVIVVQPPSNTTPPCPAFVAYIRELSDKVKTDTLNHYDYKNLKADTEQITRDHAAAIAACPKE